MRRITVGAMVSLDGVMQAPGGPTEDPTNGFSFGGWVTPYFDEVFGEEVDRVLHPSCDFPARPQDVRDLCRVLAAPRRGCARRRHRPALQADQEVRRVALGRGGHLVGGLRPPAGSGSRATAAGGGRPRAGDAGQHRARARAVRERPVDALSVFTLPVVLGGGKKLFTDGAAVPRSFTLSRSRVSSTGLVVSHYQRAGEIRTADTAMETPSDAERARQARMQREG